MLRGCITTPERVLLFNRRFDMKEMTDRIANAVCCCKPFPERALRVAEVYG
jgi:hypothetical protein